MFRRRNSQKPSEDFYTDFKASFASLGPPTTVPVSEPTPAQSCNTMNTGFDMAFESSHLEGQDEFHNHESTPRDHSADFKSLFEYYPTQDDGYWGPPTPSGSIPFNSQIMSTNRGTPLSRPMSGSAVAPSHSGTFIMQDFERRHPHQFQNIDPSSHQQALESLHYHPQLAGYESAFPLQQSVDHGLTELDFIAHNSSSSYPYDTGAFDEAKLSEALQTSSDRFRFRVTLNAPTAMVKHDDEIPVTYLNKCQTYSISIKDTMFDGDGPCQYRTSVRVSFEDQQQRSKPDSCWELWRDTRGKKEAHQRGGRLQAVEYVRPNHGHVDDVGFNVELAAEPPTDGFCVLWTPTQPGTAECTVSVRFNFLSTDFSHSKGVKGIPLRLCAKTEIVGSQPGISSLSWGASEACYCTVKLFRDHGAERKLSNDVSHVKKMVEKLKQQIIQQDGGVKENGKRRRSDSTNRASANTRPTKVIKHKRSWSMSSTNSDADQGSTETDLRAKVAVYQAMYTSTRPVSILFLKGEEQDDPDLHPVHLGVSTQDVLLLDTSGLERQDTLKTNTSSAVSPVPSSISVNSPFRRGSVFNNNPSIFNPRSRLSSNEWVVDTKQTLQPDVLSSNPQHLASPPDGPTKIEKLRQDHNMDTKEWIETLDVDQTYQPPPEPVVKPVACFYVRTSIIGKRAGDDYYRAIYLFNRTLDDFVKGVTAKYNIDSATIDNTIRVLDNGLQVKVDDDVVRQIPDGQDILTELYVKTQHAATAKKQDVDEKAAVGTDIGRSAGFLLMIRY